MSFAFFCKLNQAFGVMLLGVLFGVAGFSATVEVKDLDLWLHMKMGEYILTHGVVPVVDVLSASAQGMPWINHEWLFQVVVFLVKDNWGMDGLLYMQVILVLATCLILLFLTYHPDRQLLAAVMMGLMYFVYQTRFTLRPDLFSFLFFALFIYILSARLDERWAIPVLFVLQVLWTNMHGYFLLGILFVFIGIISEAIKRHVPLPWEWAQEGRLTDDEYRRLWWAFFFLVLATFVNPFGLQGSLYPLNILKAVSGDSKIFFENITELQRPITMENLTLMTDNWPLRMMIFTSFLSFFFNRRNIDISALLFWIVMLVFGLMALRNMTYFAITAYLVTMVNASNLKVTDLVPFKAEDEKFVQVTGIMARIAIICYLMNYGNSMSVQGYYDFDKYERKSVYLGVDLRAFPRNAADFLIKNGFKGRIFNDFNSGAYLIGRTYPDIIVYMDGRTELRGPKFFEQYRKMWDQGDEKLFDREMERFKMKGVFASTAMGAAPEKFLQMMSRKKDYKVVYLDYDAVIFLKDIPENAEFIKKHYIDLSKWKTKKLDIRRFGPALASPYQNMARAQSLLAMGYIDQAVAEANAALEIDPTYSQPYRLRGRVCFDSRDWENAFRNFRIVLASEPDDIRLRGKLAMSYLELGETDYALKEAEKMISRAPGDAQGYYMKAKALIKKKEYKNAYDIAMSGLRMAPKTTNEMLEVGDVAFKDKLYDQAEIYYREGVARDPKNASAHEKMCILLRAQGKNEKAILECKKSLALKPDNGYLRKMLSEMKDPRGGK